MYSKSGELTFRTGIMYHASVGLVFKHAAIKTIKYRDVDYVTAKKEVMGYFQERGEAYPSEIEEILSLREPGYTGIVDLSI